MEVNLTNLKNAMISQMQLNDAIANNLANINTTGYKKDVVFFDALNNKMDGTGAHQSVDLSQGALKNTQNPLDLAIMGDGFFTVDTENGIGFTREGHFKLDDIGVLRNSQGYAVMGENGMITLLGENIRPNEILVTPDGEIYVDDVYVDQLAIRDFADSGELQKTGNNLYMAKDEALAQPAENAEIQQGFLEEANVNPAEEMIQLIEVQRQFESVQRMVQSLDEVLRRAVNEVGKY